MSAVQASRETLRRFDSVVELVQSCRARFPGAEINTANEDGDFLLRIRDGSWHYESLIVHFEGEGCYAVMLPSGRHRAPDPRTGPRYA